MSKKHAARSPTLATPASTEWYILLWNKLLWNILLGLAWDPDSVPDNSP